MTAYHTKKRIDNFNVSFEKKKILSNITKLIKFVQDFWHAPKALRMRALRGKNVDVSKFEKPLCFISTSYRTAVKTDL